MVDIVPDRIGSVAYLFPDGIGSGLDDTLVFQYYPADVNVTVNTEYSDKTIPGGSHPLTSWIGAGGKDISFTAVFTAEVDGESPGQFSRYTVDVNAAVAKVQSFLLPSYDGPGINNLASPPKKLWLVLRGLNLGGNQDAILTVLKSAPITYQALFPSGRPRVVEMSLSFAEIVQHSQQQQGSNIRYIGRDVYQDAGRRYNYRGSL